MKEFSRICFRTGTADGLSDFYGRLLGMTETADGPDLSFGYGANQCRLSFEPGDYARRQASGEDLYWKIGLTVRHLESALDHLERQGWPVTAPRQFEQIGYLCHLQDPEGNAIELLQQGFEGRAGEPPTGHPIASQATIAHITFRVGDIATCRAYLEAELGLRLMSIQPVPDHGFTLYFFSWSDEPLPDPDLKAVANREWLWARPYPLLELQHLDRGAPLHRPGPNESGFTVLYFGKSRDTSEEIDLHRLV